MLDKEEQWSQTVIAKIVEMFGSPHDCTLADEKAVEEALAADLPANAINSYLVGVRRRTAPPPSAE